MKNKTKNMDYEKILKGIVQIINTTEKSDIGFANICTYIGENCPELKESEDEKHRKWIIAYLNDEFLCADELTKPKLQTAIAWLEKQGKQSIQNIPTREIILAIWDLGNEWKELTHGNINTKYETQLDYIQKHWQESEYYLRKKQGEQKSVVVIPKFHEGDWIVKENIVYHIDKISGVYLTLSTLDGTALVYHISVLDSDKVHFWTIEDAKDGDVLAWNDSKCIALFKNIYDKDSFNSHGFVGHCTGVFESRLSYHDIKGAHPATKEQRDTFERAITNAGYRWDKEKLKLEKI